MRIAPSDTTAYEYGTIITDTDEYRIIARGQVRVNTRTVYQVRETWFKATDNVELHLVGPRGAYYWLQDHNDTGVYRAVSMGSGTSMHRQGNEVFFMYVGEELEAVSKNVVNEVRRFQRAHS